VSVAVHRVTGGCEAYTARKQALKIQLRKPAGCDADAVNKAEGSIRFDRYCEVVSGSPKSLARGNASKGISQEPRRALHLLHTMGGTDRQGQSEATGTDG
jgi:hypothetical protein